MHTISRRSFLIASAVAPFVGAAAQAPAVLAAGAERYRRLQARAGQVRVETTRLRSGMSLLSAPPAGNVVVLTGTKARRAGDGPLMVDSGYTSSQPQLAAALASLDAIPVERLVNTHCHWDHVGGNAWLHAGGATITAAPKLIARVHNEHYIPAFGLTVPPLPKEGWPVDLVHTDREFRTHGETVRLLPFPPAHTDTDLAVFFADADILAVGDLLVTGDYPFIDYSYGGTIDGAIRAAERNLGLTTRHTMVVPGHGPVGSREDLLRTHDMLTGMRERVSQLKRRGLSLKEIQASRPSAPYDKFFGAEGSVAAQDFVTQMFYEGLG